MSQITHKKNSKKKFLTVFLFILIALVALLWGTFDKTSDNSYCSSCHMMKPEVYTWKASSHNQVDCVACHIEQGVMTKVRYKLFSVKEWYSAITGDYGIAIQMVNPIPDVTCTQCHDMKTRNVTPSGDLIIPHSKHMQLNVSCTQCHTGVAHGNIVKKRVTFRTDYEKWDESIGQSIMSDPKNLRPDMDVCMNCHKVRKAPLNCSACHTTSMIPSNHKGETFKNGAHGEEAAKNILSCDSCHSYMSKETVEVSKGNQSAFQQFLSKNNDKPGTISVKDYAKANTFCTDCHKKRPVTHSEDFQLKHGAIAEQSKDRCFTCHDNRPQSVLRSNSSISIAISCGSCHPSTHYKKPWQQTHPVELPPKPQVTEFCYTCHSQKCAVCHTASIKSRL